MQPEETINRLVTHAKSSQTNGTSALSKLSKQSSDIVADWLTLYAKAFPQEELSPELVLLYRSLAKRYSPQRLHLGFEAAMLDAPSARRGFMPKPGEVAEQAEKIELEEQPSRTDQECKACLGTGWRPSNAGDRHSPHVSCECAKSA